MKFRIAIALAATTSVLAPVGAASAASIYDARTLGMGGSSIGYSGNASLAYWNPAAVGQGNSFGLYLPSVSAAFGNNVLSLPDAMKAAQSFQNLGKAGDAGAGANPASLFSTLGNGGLNLQAESLTDVIGLSLGNVGPGSMAVRVYGHALSSTNVRMSNDFSQDMNSLFLQGGFTDITQTVAKISAATGNPAANQQQLMSDVGTLKTQLQKNMGSFIKVNGAATTQKSLNVDSTTSANAALAATYAQPIKLELAAFPDAQLTLGATAKVLAAPALGGIGAVSLPGSANGAAKLSPLGGGVGASVNLNIDKEVTDLVNAIDAFQDDQNLATTAELASKTGAFLSNGLAKSDIAFTNTVPDPFGAGVDLGASLKLNSQWAFGASVANPVLFWGATQSTYKYDFSGDSIVLQNKGTQKVSFSQAEPTVVRLGTSYQPKFAGAPAIADGLLLTAGVDAPLNAVSSNFSGGLSTFKPSVSLGAEKLFGPLAVRLGTQQGGVAPLLTGGLGLQTRAFQFNLGAGVDPGLKGAAAALSLGAGF